MSNYETYLPGQGMEAACGVYPKSVHQTDAGQYVYMLRVGKEDFLAAEASLGFTGTAYTDASGKACVLAPLNHENANVLRQVFPFTAPVPVLGERRSVGVGDRLGIATPGHLRVFERYDALPVLAQQSIRELNLTSRNYEHVLDCASYAVFREDFRRGFGADGDHLKKAEEVNYALSCGYTMITLDCSEHMHNDVAALSDEEVAARYSPLPELEAKYVGKTFSVGERLQVHFDAAAFRRIAMIYLEVIDFAEEIYHQCIEGKQVNFEISIDETTTPTTPQEHFFVANELTRRGIRFETVAPRFCGEFQKGVDYIGDLKQFRKEIEEHAAIAEHFGYKLSIHSGSDKFSVFPSIGEFTKGHFHVKTAGTNWLEAMKLVAMCDPALYREVHAYALAAFDGARKFYHVTTDLNKVPALENLTDAHLPGLFDLNDARQLIHITYGSILTEKTADGKSLFRDRLYDCWDKYAEQYAQLLDSHIGHHLELLYQGF